ncbi:prepilin-type N-terminal cleavage/methylation domain-containing protein [Roseateles sp.]|uniref:prepilin-type N-terminal cleavage/methylation domain-containing protein n=1 Tax=Roseateles sp. TaxID=1971397 RepID=UPI003267759F
MKSFQTQASRSRPQRGTTLIEALVALVIMSFGMVALVGLTGNLRRSGDLAKQRSEAMRMAQAELATLRDFSVLDRGDEVDPAANVRDYKNDMVSPPDVTVPLDNANTTFTVTRSVTPLVKDLTEPQGKTVRVKVEWPDRSGIQQSVTLDSVISRTDPVFSMALGVTPPTNGIRQPDNRNPAIPRAAKDLGNGTSAFRPRVNNGAIWVFNNVTGIITGICEISINTAVSALTASSVETCKNNGGVGYLVSGTIRFSTGSTPDSRNPADAAQRLSVRVVRTPSQLMVRDLQGVESLAAGGNDYPALPTPACFTDDDSASPLTQTLMNYYCLVYPNSQKNWSGQVLLGSPLDIGSSASQFKVCRYSGDYNGNGYTEDPYSSTAKPDRIDNEEHPALYRHVSYSLARQNFLVIRSGDGTACPLSPVNNSLGYFIDAATYQIQP